MIQPKNILIVRTDRIGDVVLSLPLAAVIKKYYPDCKVTFLLREYTKDLAFNHPDIDSILLLKESKNKILLGENLAQIKTGNFDACLIVSPTFKVALILFLSGIKNRIGTGYRWYSLLFNRRIYEHRKYGERHEFEYNLRMLSSMGINENINEDSVSYKLQVSDKSKQSVNIILKKFNINNELPLVIVHPGSGGSSIDLPISSVKELVKMLAHELKVNVIITGLLAEKDLCNELIMNENVFNLAGKLNLSDLIAMINKSDLLIANSTGPIHVAAALKKHVIGFYPKINACSPTRWGPYTNKKAIFTPTINCENYRKQCEELNCMNSIDVKEVFNRGKEILTSITMADN